MSRKRFDDHTTAEVIKRMVAAASVIESSAKRHSKWNTWFGLRYPKWRMDHVWQMRTEALATIGIRYQGVLTQMFLRACEAGQHRPVSLYVYINSWITYVLDETPAAQPAEFPLTLWRAAEQVVGDEFGLAIKTSIQNLKPKFLLRPFIDQLPEQTRSTLLAYAYNVHSPTMRGGHGVTSGTLAAVDSAYADLRKLLKGVRNLQDITEGAVSAEPFSTERYDDWFFPS